MGQYPWNTQGLVKWLKAEMSAKKSFHQLSLDMQIPYSVLQEWMTLAFPAITLEHIKLIADYRDWSVEKTTTWLNIKPAHFAEMSEEFEHLNPIGASGKVA